MLNNVLLWTVFSSRGHCPGHPLACVCQKSCSSSELFNNRRNHVLSVAKSREIYERAVEFYGEEHMNEKLLMAFGKFEENSKEVGVGLVCYCAMYVTIKLSICLSKNVCVWLQHLLPRQRVAMCGTFNGTSEGMQASHEVVFILLWIDDLVTRQNLCSHYSEGFCL